MLIEQLQRMQRLLEARDERRNEKKVLQALISQEEALTELLARWQDLAQMVGDLGCDATIIQQFRTDIWGLKARFEQGASIQQNEIRQIQETMKEIEDALTVEWLKRSQAIREDVLLARARIASVIGSRQERSTLLRAYGNIDTLLNLSLPTSGQFRTLASAWSQMEQTVEAALPPMSKEVEFFLEKLSMQQATLNDLTPEVITWCREQDLLNKITLHFTGE